MIATSVYCNGIEAVPALLLKIILCRESQIIHEAIETNYNNLIPHELDAFA